MQATQSVSSKRRTLPTDLPGMALALPYPEKLILQNRDHDDDQKQEDCDGRADAAVIEAEGFAVHELQQHIGGIKRPALGHQVDLIENLQLQDQLQRQNQ